MDFTLTLDFIKLGAYDKSFYANLETKGKLIVLTKNGAYMSGHFYIEEFIDSRYVFVDDISALWFDPDTLSHYALLPEPEPDPED